MYEIVIRKAVEIICSQRRRQMLEKHLSEKFCLRSAAIMQN